MLDTRIQDGIGIVEVEGRPFARFALEPVAEPWKYYGCRWSLKIWPALERQREPTWTTQYQHVRELIFAYLSRQN